MSCAGGACNPSSNFPSPNDRIHGNGHDMTNRPREGRRPTFFSRRIAHVSNRAVDIAQSPTSISLRETAIVLLVLYGLYRGYFATAQVYNLVAHQRVGVTMCFNSTLAMCLRETFWRIFGVGFNWTTEVLPWACVAIVTVFFGEEVIGGLKKKLKG